MHDLDFRETDGRTGAVEVTAAADSDSIELWKLINGSGKRWIEPGLRGGWLLSLRPNACAKRLRRDLPAFLKLLEGQGVDSIHPLSWRPLTPVEEQARILGIVSGDRGSTDFTGSIYLTIERPFERSGGVRDPTGAMVSPWVHDFLTAPARADVLAKLSRSGAKERHAFIVLPGLSTAPFAVEDMLLREEDEAVPSIPPSLPAEVTHIWLMTFWVVGSGMRWSPDGGWSRFQRRFHDPGQVAVTS